MIFFQDIFIQHYSIDFNDFADEYFSENGQKLIGLNKSRYTQAETISKYDPLSGLSMGYAVFEVKKMMSLKYHNISDINKVDLLLKSCVLVIDDIDKNELILKINQMVLNLQNSITTNNFDIVPIISKQLAGESDFDSIHVIASYIFENDYKNERKLMFVLEVLYRVINKLYTNGCATNVDSFFWEEPIDDDMTILYNLIKDFEDDEILIKFGELFNGI